MRHPLIALLLLSLACGSNGYKDAAAKCASPRVGVINPNTGAPYPDRQGSLSDEKTWLRGWIDDYYLWYREVPSVDPNQYSTAVSYFAQLKTPAITASGKPKDQFHFTYDTTTWQQLSQSGVEAGYGATWALVARSPPRLAYVAYTEPGSPATAAGVNLARGAQLISVDGAAVLDGAPAVLNAGLFPATIGEKHTFVVQDRGSTAQQQRTISLTSTSVTSTPVQHVGLIGTTTVGYMLFNSHIATAEAELINAINQLKSLGATDLVLDLRYNGGGYLFIASELAYMISKPGATNGRVFEKEQFNDKYPNSDPIYPKNPTTTPFYTAEVGLGVSNPPALPYLGLDHVSVIVGSGTCSASEAVINGLLGVGVQVNLIGGTTCGKPYGFYPQDNCGTTYFSIQFKGVNDKGFGDYADGFTPSGSSTATGSASPPGCLVADDFTHDLGDPAEARLATALSFKNGNACPPATMRVSSRAVEAPDVVLVRNPFVENRILGLPR